MKKISVVVLCFYINTCLLVAQTNYYVDGTNGSDDSVGTTLGKAWKTIQKACNTAIPNSIVSIRGGVYHENIIVTISGTKDSAITIKNFKNEVVMIDGTGTSGNTLIKIIDKSYLNFENLTIQNLIKNEAQGILVECTKNGIVTNLLFKNIIIKNISWTTNSSVIPTEYDNAQAFVAYGKGNKRSNPITNLTIDSCEVYENILGFSEAISLDGNIDGFIIKNNKIHHNTNIGILAAGNYKLSSIADLDHARNGVVEKNELFFNVSDYATSAGIYMDGAQNVLIKNNRCYRNGYGIEVGCEENGTTDSILVINNLLYNNETAGLSVGGYTTTTTGQVLNCTFRNNTLFQNDYKNDAVGELNIMKASNCIFKNNIIYTNTTAVLFNVEAISPQENNSFDYNCWYTPQNNSNDITANWKTATYSKFIDFQTSTTQDQHGFYNNPILVDTAHSTLDFDLKDTSPCIDSGDVATIIIAGELDFKNRKRISNNRIDIGAYEKGSVILNVHNQPTHSINSIYPNPTSKNVTIEMIEPFYETQLSLYDAKGQQLMNTKIKNGKMTLNMESFSAGVYFIRLVNKKTVELKKIIKQ
ncbi:MAG: T9SS type A sorting domain-containing protein [Bacteroidia bacterium]